MKKLLSLLGIRPEEWPRVRWMVLHSVALGLSKVTAISAGNTLFVSTFGAGAFPFLYMASAVMMPFLTLALGQVEKRLPFTRYLAIALGLTLALTVGLRLALAATGGRALIFAIALLVEIVYVLGGIAFWGLTARLFDVREAKRLTGLVSAGEVLAFAAGGLLIPWIVSRVGTANLLLLTAAAVTVSLVTIAAVARSFPERVESVARSDRRENDPDRRRRATAGGGQPDPPAAATTVDDSYLRLIYTVSVFLISAYYFADNLFYERLETRFSDPDRTAAFVGTLFGAAALFTFGARMVAGRLMVKLGLMFGLMIEPVLLVAATLALVAVGTIDAGGTGLLFWIVMVIKMLERVTLDGFGRGAGMVLVQPLPAAERTRVHAFRVGVVESIGGGVAGALLWLLFGYLELSAVAVGAALLLLMLGWIGVNFLVRSAYLEALTAALSRRVLGGGELPVDRGSLELIEGKLAGDHAGEVLYALELIVEHDPERLARLLSPLLEHSAPAVRRRVLEIIAERQIGVDASAIRALIAGDPEPAVRGDAVRTLIALGEHEAFDEVVPYLEGSDRELARGAMAGLLESGSIEAIMAAGERFVALKGSAEPADRTLAAKVIGEVGIGTFYRPLLELLRDPEPQVRRQALLACRRVSNPRLWPTVIEDLAGPRSSPEAVQALRQAGAGALPALERAFERPGLATEARVRMARAAAGIPGAEGFLWRHREHPDPEVRHGVLAALATRRFRAGDRRGEVVAGIRRETAAVAETCRFLTAVLPAEDADTDLLEAAIRYDGERCAERVLLHLSSIYPADSISRVRASLDRGGEQRAYAVELLDNLLDPELKPEVLVLFESLEPAQRLKRLSAALATDPGSQTATWKVGRKAESKARTGELDLPRSPVTDAGDVGRLAAGDLGWPSPWTRACALDLLARRGGEEARRRLRTGLEDTAPVVRDTARHQLAWLEARGAHAQSPPPVLALIPLLRQAGIFAETPDQHLAAVTAVATELALEAGDTFIHEGEDEHSMYVLAAGRVKVHSGERTLGEFGPGDSIGELEAIDSQQRSASVTTLTAVRLLRIEQAALQQILAERQEVARGALRVLVQRLRQLG